MTHTEALKRLKAIDSWLDTPHPKGGVWLDYVDDAFMDAWDNADSFDLASLPPTVAAHREEK